MKAWALLDLEDGEIALTSIVHSRDAAVSVAIDWNGVRWAESWKPVRITISIDKPKRRKKARKENPDV